MTICVMGGKYCCCQPDDGVACPFGTPTEVQAALNTEGMRRSAEIERLRADRDCEKRLRKDAEDRREALIEAIQRMAACESIYTARTIANVALHGIQDERPNARLTCPQGRGEKHE